MTTPTASPDAWRRIAAPGGYEGWHFSATSDDQTTHLVAALHATWALDRTYLRRYRTYRRRPTRVAPPIAAEYPAVTFALYERGRRAIVVAARATKDQFSADPAGQSVRVNASHAQRAAGGVLNLNLRGGTRDGRTLAARLAFRPHVGQGAQVALVSPDAKCGDHGWVVADPLCDVNGEVSIFDSALGAPRVIPFAGVGCHDHLWGTRAMEDASPQWIGGRILREDHAVLFRSIHPRLAQVCDVRTGETPQLRQATLTTEGVRRTWRGLAYPAALTIEGVADLAEPKVVDSSWHSLVLEYRATVGDDRALALVELLRPRRRIWSPPW
jgi:hypothetical protein